MSSVVTLHPAPMAQRSDAEKRKDYHAELSLSLAALARATTEMRLYLGLFEAADEQAVVSIADLRYLAESIKNHVLKAAEHTGNVTVPWAGDQPDPMPDLYDVFSGLVILCNALRCREPPHGESVTAQPILGAMRLIQRALLRTLSELRRLVRHLDKGATITTSSSG